MHCTKLYLSKSLNIILVLNMEKFIYISKHEEGKPAKTPDKSIAILGEDCFLCL